MALFAVTYDLIKRKDYPKLWEEFERLGAHKPVRSLYLLNANNTATEVRDHFEQFIDDDDRLFVIEFGKKPKHHKALKGTNDWINEHC